MKKLMILSAMALVSLNLSAQIYVGGGLGVDFNGKTTNTTSVAGTAVTTTTPGNFSVSLKPNVGYILSDKLSAGARLGIELGPNWKNDDLKTAHSEFAVGINPYARYNVFSFGKFGIAAEGGLSFVLDKETDVNDLMGKTVKDFNTGTTLSVYVKPVLTYALDDHFTLEADLNFCNLAFNMTNSKQTNSEDSDYAKQAGSTFALGADSSNVFNLGVLNVGFTYKF